MANMNPKTLKRWITICDVAFFLLVVLMIILFLVFRSHEGAKMTFLWAAIPAIVVRIASYVLRHINR
ncbi:MAG: hypothetical protein MR676_07320 [Porphyromonas sp.]|nr:hypothetical protein [Porphyromonas sp.]MDY3102708.1 hypothetical protein [Porphyromonas sp.]